jgi:photosystem II stability/assembly factor-like uncharacterized protein
MTTRANGINYYFNRLTDYYPSEIELSSFTSSMAKVHTLRAVFDMKHVLIFFALASVPFCANTSFSQSSWFWQNPSPTGQMLYAVSSLDTNTVIAVGSFGTLLRSTDGGLTWKEQLIGTAHHLNGVSFGDASSGTVVGNFGLILHTTNAGATWITQSSGTSDGLVGVCFIDAETGTVVGDSGTILRTTNGGATWTAQTSGTTNYLESVDFVDANKGTAVGSNGTILRTTNGGATWTAQTSGTTGILCGVHLTDDSTGTAVGWAAAFMSYNGLVLRTTDGGATWAGQTILSTRLYAVQFRDAKTGTAVGTSGVYPYNGAILHTTDGGVTWVQQSTGATYEFNGVHLTDTRRGWAVGAYGAIFNTTDGGTTWSAQSSLATRATLYGGCFVDENSAFVVGANGAMLRTTDRGSTWSPPGGSFGPIEFHSIAFANADSGIAVGNMRASFRTTNRGATWEWQSSVLGFANEVCFPSAHVGFMVGGGIAKTTDGGASWLKQTAGAELAAVCFTDTNTGTAVGSTVMLRTTDGGVNWTDVPGMTNYMLTGVSFTDANTGTAVGNDQSPATIIIRTTDGGTTWTNQSSGLPGYTTLTAVRFVDAQTGIVVGTTSTDAESAGPTGYSIGVILRTSNGGSTWKQDPFTTYNTLSRAFSLDAHTLMAVGFNGTILRTDNGGLTSIKGDPLSGTTIHRYVALLQNYPNPFNPSTTIRYSLPHRTPVTLAVFNILGQQVALLQNGDQDTGFHEVRFDGSRLASGVYFYRIQAGDFVQTKKLALVK